MYLEIILFCFLGIFTGLFAGMLGIGGGVFIVPGLSMIFSYLGFEKSLVIKYAIATSLGIIFFTAISSVYVHIKKSNVRLDILKKLILGIIIGTIIGSYIDHLINEKYLKIIFGIYLFLIGVKMVIGFKEKEHKKTLSKKLLFTVGSIVGLKSGILGVGGGSISIPFLRFFGVSMRKAAGTSAGITFIISIVGSISFIFFGEQVPTDQKYFLGYIYLPAFFWVGVFTAIFANIGARLTNKISNKSLQMIFGILLFILSFKMLFYDFFIS